MKKVIHLVFAITFAQFRLVMGDVSHNFRYGQTDLHFFVTTPPALVFVEDKQGRRAGADPFLSINANGTQGNQVTGLTEIPLSHVIQINDSAFDGTNFEQKDDTTWNIDIYDSGPQTFTVNVKGLVDGFETISVSGIYRQKGKEPLKKSFNVFSTPGQIRKIDVFFDPLQKMISYSRLVSKGDLFNDLKISCQQNFIASEKICENLEKKAFNIQGAFESNKRDKAEELLKNFLRSLEGKEDLGDNVTIISTIQEPALDILKEDAKALLESLQKDDGHGHGDDGDGKSRRGDNRSFFDRLFGWL